ncbi:hypothetical protein O181_120944 [Austropuccinia psidii MF-1]|uniref:Uncharacterized protein n=1 Tax=Austropuccinia psidii MF-1 TaxID=1389203 RepID=A0A9Q3KK43_9BASI|nr:hypothetical protein [Austropuccinia psidii MF-1]
MVWHTTLGVEATLPSNQMDLDMEIEVLNPKDKNTSPEERHIWRMPQLPPASKDLNNFQEAAVEIPVSVQELVYCSKVAGVKTSANPLDRDNELLPPSKELEEGDSSKEGQHHCGSSPSLQKHQKREAIPKEKLEGKVQMEQTLPSELQNSKEIKDSLGQCVQYDN